MAVKFRVILGCTDHNQDMLRYLVGYIYITEGSRANLGYPVEYMDVMWGSWAKL
jgi:hypothetical protein